MPVMATKLAPKRLSLASATTASTINSPCSIPSEAMSTPRTPFSPGVKPFVPSQAPAHSPSLSSQEYRNAQDHKHRVEQARLVWQHQDRSFRSHVQNYHPNLEHICPKLTRLPYHWSELAHDLQEEGCLCFQFKLPIPCLRHEWNNRWIWLATGGPWRKGRQEFLPKVRHILQRALDPVVFREWVTFLPCECEELSLIHI